MKNCILCAAKLKGQPLLSLCGAPACAQDLPGEDELASDHGLDLNLYQCPACGLVQFDCEPVSYYRDVIRGGGFSETLQKLRREQYAHLIDRYRLEGKKIIEIGCGEGEFVQPLASFPVKAYGIENREALVKKAKERGLNVWKAFPETPDTILEHGPYDAFVMFNFLEHQPRPNDMLRCIYNNLTDDGIGLVTVPSFEYIYGKKAIYEFMRDHIAYYTRDSLRLMMEHNGFEILEMEIVNGNTISVVVRKRKKINLSPLLDNLEALKNSLRTFVKEKTKEGKKIAVWGASHQAFTILSITGFGEHVSYVIDSAPFKQGKFTPASHILITAPENLFAEPVDCIVVIAPEYSIEIAKCIKARFGREIEIYSIESSQINEISLADKD